jgi:DNA-binding MarR family transcriptional regulator
MPDAAGFGDVLRRDPGLVATDELAASLRVPVTILADALRRRTYGFDLPPAQARVLSQLSAGDSLSLSQLAQSHQLASSSMTELVNRLVEADLVTKEQGVGDRREMRVSITKQGLKRLAHTSRTRTAELIDLLDRLGEEDRLMLAAALPALWRLADIDPDLWPRLRPRSRATTAGTATTTSGGRHR